MGRGRFISLEGGEGCGKSTQAGLLAGYLEGRGIPCLLTRQPGGSELGLKLREILSRAGTAICGRAELSLFLADRAQHVEAVIRPALEKGQVVICDRFADSSEVYQGRVRGLDRRWVRRLNNWACANIWPDITIVLDIKAETGLARAAGRGAGLDRIEAEGLEFHRRVRQGFLDQAAEEPERLKVVAAGGGREEIAAEIRRLVEPLLGLAP